ncbi:sigma-54 interaction domain-containing protein [Bacillus sp. NTK034]|uniref:sigma-54 interaction domain-containing protein n=1 Tax=Bacillus sp. NTK034 TaxID=2802176 RepID=UPI001A90B317|nr:sigma 54-interacting transcriptional regulator [Bacillus sp. NTK034]MBN8201425.1 sigma 54-interacting transcriptional regulator [Bacillus sp. NTK034]
MEASKPFDYESQLKAYQEMSKDLQAIFDLSFDVIYVSDARGVTLRASSACKALWGKEVEELVGKSVLDLEKEGLFTPSITRLVLERKEKVSGIQTTSTGKRLMVVGTPIKDENGKIVRVVNASRDITELHRLEEELEEMRLLSEGYKKEIMLLKEEKESFSRVVFASEEMKKVLEMARRVAKVDTTVLILGESGVGKEVIVNQIHHSSPRREKPFIKVNCGAIPENLLESELFGYESGAFTGANKQGKKGLFELANGGTLFLDEIAEMPLALQVKLLRILQDQEITRVGGTRPVKVDVRILAAANRDLTAEIEKGRFREDLFYRLHVVPITIPRLKDRRKDILPLLLHFIQYYNQKYFKKTSLTPGVIHMLEQYHWPGNVRELQNIVERLVVTTDENEITVEHFTQIIELVSNSKKKVEIHDLMPLRDCIESAEEQLLKLAAKRFKSTTKMAKALNVNQSTISRKLQKLGIRRP